MLHEEIGNMLIRSGGRESIFVDKVLVKGLRQHKRYHDKRYLNSIEELRQLRSISNWSDSNSWNNR